MSGIIAGRTIRGVTHTTISDLMKNNPTLNIERFIDEATDDGWRLVLMDKYGKKHIPQGTRVKFGYVDDAREYFTILEGKYKNEKASLTKEPHSYLTSRNRIKPKAELKLYKKQKKLEVNGKTYDAFSGTGFFEDFSTGGAIPTGKYYLEMPDEPHSELGNTYKDETKYATSWFRIAYIDGGGYVDDRYLHAGYNSLGCITVYDIKAWTEIYEDLIYRRIDRYSGKVGIIEVFD